MIDWRVETWKKVVRPLRGGGGTDSQADPAATRPGAGCRVSAAAGAAGAGGMRQGRSTGARACVPDQPRGGGGTLHGRRRRLAGRVLSEALALAHHQHDVAHRAKLLCQGEQLGLRAVVWQPAHVQHRRRGRGADADAHARRRRYHRLELRALGHALHGRRYGLPLVRPLTCVAALDCSSRTCLFADD